MVVVVGAGAAWWQGGGAEVAWCVGVAGAARGALKRVEHGYWSISHMYANPHTHIHSHTHTHTHKNNMLLPSHRSPWLVLLVVLITKRVLTSSYKQHLG